MASHYTVAEEMLGAASAQRGLGGMSRTAAPIGPNMMDGGAASKVGVNPQPYNNQRLQIQNIQQNTSAAVPQAQADAVMDVRKQQLVQNNAEYKAQEFAENRKAEVLHVMGAPAIAEMSMKSGPEVAKIRHDVATGKAMAMGANPDLIANAIA